MKNLFAFNFLIILLILVGAGISKWDHEIAMMIVTGGFALLKQESNKDSIQDKGEVKSQ